MDCCRASSPNDKSEGSMMRLLQSYVQLVSRRNGLLFTKIKIRSDVPPARAGYVRSLIKEYVATAAAGSTEVEGMELLEAKIDCYKEATMELSEKQRQVKRKKERVEEMQYEAAELEKEVARMELEICDALEELRSHARLVGNWKAAGMEDEPLKLLEEAESRFYEHAGTELYYKQMEGRKKRERIRELEYEASEMEKEAARLQVEISDGLEALHSHAVLQ